MVVNKILIKGLSQGKDVPNIRGLNADVGSSKKTSYGSGARSISFSAHIVLHKNEPLRNVFWKVITLNA